MRRLATTTHNRAYHPLLTSATTSNLEYSTTCPHRLLSAPLTASSGPEREHRVRADFLDVSEPNIHPVWETTVLLWISKLPWLKQRVPPNFEQATRESLAAYFKTKPWARRAHPSIVAQGEEAEEVRRVRHARQVE